MDKLPKYIIRTLQFDPTESTIDQIQSIDDAVNLLADKGYEIHNFHAEMMLINERVYVPVYHFIFRLNFEPPTNNQLYKIGLT